MIGARRLLRGVLASAAVVAAAGAGFATPAVAAPGPAAADRAKADAVSVSIQDVTPSVPSASGRHALTVTLLLQNRTERPLGTVRIDGVRGEPIQSQAALEHAVRTGAAPSNDDVAFPSTRPVTTVLGPEARATVTFTTYTSVVNDGRGICLCHPHAIYPLYFSAHTKGPDGVDQQLGVVGTYLPAFYAKPQPVRVSWVWPLLDRPHRLTGSTTFTDDQLAGEVAAGGRLARALDVVAQAAARVPLTLVVDPELLDEIQVMATQPYQVQTSAGHTTPGTGKDAAALWLAELRDVLTAHPKLAVDLTPYADPDVESATRNNLTWTPQLPAAVRSGVDQALSGHAADMSVAWPAGGAVSGKTLDALIQSGAGTVLLNSAAVTPRPSANAVPPGLARLRAGGEDVAVALLNPTLQQSVSDAVGVAGAGAAALPQLIAELAIRAVQQPGDQHVAVLAPPRYVDASVAATVRTMEETSRSTFATPVTLAEAVGGDLLPGARSRLAPAPASAATLPDATVDLLTQAASSLPPLQALLDRQDPRARALLAGLTLAQQRALSSAWGRGQATAAGEKFARQLATEVSTLIHGVKIIRPPYGSYTLASNNSPLPITVENDLPYQVNVQVQVVAENGLLGFTGRTTAASIEAKSKRTIHVPTQVDRSGRIKVQASLLTPQGIPIGDPVPLTVHSTALGVIGVVITIGAGVVLGIALLLRVGRRWRKRRHGVKPGQPRFDPDVPAIPEPAS